MKYFLLLFFLSGCATISGSKDKNDILDFNKSYEEKLDSWIGRSGRDLIYSWGPPSSSFQMNDGNQMVTWHTEKPNIFQGIDTCDVSFEVETNDQIIHWLRKGNCY